MAWRGFLIRAFAVALLAPGGGVTWAQDAPPEDLASQLRLQGHRCDEPVTAQRDAQLSKPDEVVWNLRCSNASYRMRLTPDMAARVEALD
ncbi:hypothetical protein [Microvirga subterranea]|uniref:PepSY domain-containing protein n=1 Tax=Microvirga subterranea TaxID=186651 RepID=A0A370HMQ6_9HYPH|nr:hypothetical protein [Microvirga subterranea]RDI59779.1 hypothetical protein DES45_10330 [Microvirga subterranea]